MLSSVSMCSRKTSMLSCVKNWFAKEAAVIFPSELLSVLISPVGLYVCGIDKM